MIKRVLLIMLIFILAILISVLYNKVLKHLDQKPVNMIDLQGKNIKYKVITFENNHNNGFYYIEATSIKNNKKEISYAPIMYSPVSLEQFLNKEVNIKGTFVIEDGLTNQCKIGWESWCKKISAYGNNELHLESIQLVHQEQ